MLLVFIAAQVIPAGVPFRCTPIRVWDGDGPIWCAEGPRVRVAGIATRESDGTCRPGHPCPAAPPAQARAALVQLLGRQSGTARGGHAIVRGPTLRCVSSGGAGGKRTGAWCISPTTGDISCSMVASGTALPWPRYWKRHRC